MRNERTDIAMVNSGQWAKAGRKHYRHASGIEVVYRPNVWAWEIVGGAGDGLRFGPLHAARSYVEYQLAKGAQA